MTRIDAKLPEGLSDLLAASGNEGMFRGKSDAVRASIRAYFHRHPDEARAALRVLVTADDEVELTLADAVRLTGQPPAEFPEEVLSILQTNTGTADGGESDET